MTSFIVRSKDLFDRQKNPHLSLSPREILNNPKIPKRKLEGKGVLDCPISDKETHWDQLELERRLGK